MNSGTLYNINDPYKIYGLSVGHYLLVHEESNSMPSNDSTQRRVYKPQNPPKLPMFDTIVQWVPAWAYGALIGIDSLIGITLAIVFFGFALHFIITHGSLF